MTKTRRKLHKSTSTKNKVTKRKRLGNLKVQKGGGVGGLIMSLILSTFSNSPTQTGLTTTGVSKTGEKLPEFTNSSLKHNFETNYEKALNIPNNQTTLTRKDGKVFATGSTYHNTNELKDIKTQIPSGNNGTYVFKIENGNRTKTALIYSDVDKLKNLPRQFYKIEPNEAGDYEINKSYPLGEKIQVPADSILDILEFNPLQKNPDAWDESIDGEIKITDNKTKSQIKREKRVEKEQQAAQAEEERVLAAQVIAQQERNAANRSKTFTAKGTSTTTPHESVTAAAIYQPRAPSTSTAVATTYPGSTGVSVPKEPLHSSPAGTTTDVGLPNVGKGEGTSIFNVSNAAGVASLAGLAIKKKKDEEEEQKRREAEATAKTLPEKKKAYVAVEQKSPLAPKLTPGEQQALREARANKLSFYTSVIAPYISEMFENNKKSLPSFDILKKEIDLNRKYLTNETLELFNQAVEIAREKYDILFPKKGNPPQELLDRITPNADPSSTDVEKPTRLAIDYIKNAVIEDYEKAVEVIREVNPIFQPGTKVPAAPARPQLVEVEPQLVEVEPQLVQVKPQPEQQIVKELEAFPSAESSPESSVNLTNIVANKGNPLVRENLQRQIAIPYKAAVPPAVAVTVPAVPEVAVAVPAAVTVPLPPIENALAKPLNTNLSLKNLAIPFKTTNKPQLAITAGPAALPPPPPPPVAPITPVKKLPPVVLPKPIFATFESKSELNYIDTEGNYQEQYFTALKKSKTISPNPFQLLEKRRILNELNKIYSKWIHDIREKEEKEGKKFGNYDFLQKQKLLENDPTVIRFKQLIKEFDQNITNALAPGKVLPVAEAPVAAAPVAEAPIAVAVPPAKVTFKPVPQDTDYIDFGALPPKAEDAGYVDPATLQNEDPTYITAEQASNVIKPAYATAAEVKQLRKENAPTPTVEAAAAAAIPTISAIPAALYGSIPIAKPGIEITPPTQTQKKESAKAFINTPAVVAPKEPLYAVANAPQFIGEFVPCDAPSSRNVKILDVSKTKRFDKANFSTVGGKKKRKTKHNKKSKSISKNKSKTKKK